MASINRRLGNLVPEVRELEKKALGYQASRQPGSAPQIKEVKVKTEEKVKLLNQLGTKSLIEHLTQTENELQKALTEESTFKNTNHDYLATAGQDCQAVKAIQAELYIQAPGKNAAERDAWVIKQRKENPELQQAITKQREVAFVFDDLRVKTEMARRRYESTKAVLALRTAQVNFLAGEDKE